MADTKISALTDGTTAAATDRLPVARSPFGATDNRYITPVYIKDYILGLVNSWTAAQQFTTLEIGHATDTTLARASAGDLSVEGNTLYRAGGTDVAMADGGTGASLTDPAADRLLFWDDSAGVMTWLTAGSGLTITDTTITASGGGSATPPRLSRMASGYYITGPGLPNTTSAPGANVLLIVPIFVGEAGTVTRIGVHVTTAAAGNARLGIYNNNADNQPGTLVLDAGTVDTGTTGAKEITISQALSANTWYWLAIVCNAGPTFRALASNVGDVGVPYTTTNITNVEYYRAFTYAALPADESASAYTLDNAYNMPMVWVRAV